MALALASCTGEARPTATGGGPRPSDEPPAHAPVAPAWTVAGGLHTPESVLYDPETDLYLVSNINGGGHDADDNGFISRISPPPDPRIVDLAWIDGLDRDVVLHGPKGMALAGDTLYVADVGGVRRFDRRTGAPRGVVALPGALFVNDVVVHDGVVYASDTGLDPGLVVRPTQSIWRLDGEVATRVSHAPSLGGPNGLVSAVGGLWVVGFDSGQLYRLDGDQPAEVRQLPHGTLDGIVALPDGRFAVSSWEAAGVLVGQGERWARAPWTVPSPADLGLDPGRGLLLVPSFAEDRVELHPIPDGS